MERQLSTPYNGAKQIKPENVNLQRLIRSGQLRNSVLLEEHDFVTAALELRQVEPSVGSPTPESTAPIIETGSAKRDMSDFLLPSLLCCAAASGDKELVIEVLDKMPASTVNIADYDGRTPSTLL